MTIDLRFFADEDYWSRFWCGNGAQRRLADSELRCPGGAYGVLLHQGGVQLGNPMKALLCVGVFFWSFFYGLMVTTANERVENP